LQTRIRSLTLATAVLVLTTFAGTTRAGAANAPASVSCVDFNNNGACDAGDPALGPLLDAGFFDTSQPQPGYTPTSRTGIVLNGFTATDDGLSLLATGDIHVNGALKVPADLDLETETGHIVVGPHAAVTVKKGDLTLIAHTLELGDAAKLKVGGAESFSDIEVTDLKIGNRVALASSGRDSELDIYATGELALGSGLRVKLPASGTFVFNVNTNIAATGLKAKAGNIDIEALPRENASSPPTRKVEFVDSQIAQRSKDGSLVIYAGDPGDHSSRDAVTLTNTKIKAVGSIDIDPLPTVF
jgi:hypothetical protein